MPGRNTRCGVRTVIPAHARVLKARLLFHLLSGSARAEKQTGSVMVAGMLVILALLVGSLGLVAVVTGSNLASLGSGESRDAQQVAEAGADQIIATFNQPENRQLLVAGSTPPNQWTTTNAALQSPCISNANARPGGTGFPSARAVGLANGQFRNLENLAQVNQGNRRFALQSIRYSAGNQGDLDRRTVFRTFTANGTALSQGGIIPAGTTFNSLLNLDDPDGSGPRRPGTNTGHIAVTVEGRLYRPDGTFSTSTITKEFEVVPKCCGGSFGSNASGGSTSGTATPGDLGADSRFCGIDFGMITGINNGRIYSYAANDRYTRRNLQGQVVNISSILGVINDQSFVWDRTTSRVVGGIQVGCRTIPSACNSDTELEPQTTNSLRSQYLSLGTPQACLGGNGDAASIAGRAASCVPIVPLFLSTGLPSIASRYTYNWTSGQNTDTVSKQTVSSGNEQGYPIIRASSGENVNVWLRANGATGVNQVTTGPFLEYCNTRYLPGNVCGSVFNGSQIHAWAVVSQPGPVTGGIGDDFSQYADFSQFTTRGGFRPNSTPRWPSLWTTSGSSGTLERTATGRIRFFHPGNGNANWGNGLENAPAVARAVNLHALKNPVLEFQFTRNLRNGVNAGNSSALDLEYSFASGVTTDEAVGTNGGNWTQLSTISANGVVTLSGGATGLNCEQNTPTTRVYRCRIGFPPGAYGSSNRFNHYVKFRLKADSNFSNNTNADAIRDVTLNNVSILSSQATPPTNVSTAAASAPEYLNTCEYSGSFPATASFTGGFHCLGPTVDMRGLGNNLWIDSTDHSVTFYYNRSTDSRGISINSPLINLTQGGLMANVSCPRGANPLGTVPTENCKTLVSENIFNPVGEYDRFNIFGRDTTPANTCFDSGLSNQPCNQFIAIGADASATAANRSRIAGAWFYLPWGYVSICANGCGVIPNAGFDIRQNDSWNFGGRIWVRTIHNGGQTHFRVPPSTSSTLTQLVGAANSAEVSYIGWEGIDWVARSSTAARKGSLD